MSELTSMFALSLANEEARFANDGCIIDDDVETPPDWDVQYPGDGLDVRIDEPSGLLVEDDPNPCDVCDHKEYCKYRKLSPHCDLKMAAVDKLFAPLLIGEEQKYLPSDNRYPSAHDILKRLQKKYMMEV